MTSDWAKAGYTHSVVLSQCETQTERLRVLSSAPLFSLWTDCKRELEAAAETIDAMEARVKALETRLRAMEGEDA